MIVRLFQVSPRLLPPDLGMTKVESAQISCIEKLCGTMWNYVEEDKNLVF